MPGKKIKGHGGNYTVHPRGFITNRDGQKLKPRRDTGGYAIVNLKNKGESKTVRIHTVVATYFKRPGHGNQINHLSGDKFDASIGNLNRTTASQNCKHAHKTGLYGRYTPGHPNFEGVVRSHLRKGKNKVSVIKKHKRKKRK